MEIILIRHGESEDDILKVHHDADFPLTSKGIDQAHKMAKRVKDEFPPDFIWSSTLKRASQTAAILADSIGCPIQYLDELKEIDNGDLAGRLLSEVEYPVDRLPHEKLGGYGETKIEFRSRGEQIFSLIKKNSESHKRIAVISHGGMISMIISSFLQLPTLHDTFFLTNNTGIHVLEYHNLGGLIKLMNSTTHLD